MTNFFRLIHIIKQYDRNDKDSQSMNTPQQKLQCLISFDITDHRKELGHFAIWLVERIISAFENKLNPIIVSAMLQQEQVENGVVNATKCTIYSLIVMLTEFHSTLNSQQVQQNTT
jgi:hypothetical protein